MSAPLTMESEKVQLRAWVRGLVQGVGYRRFVRQELPRLGLMGRAWNLPDGRTVGVEAVGTRLRLEALLRLLRRGPSDAVVEGVEVAWEHPQGTAPRPEVPS